MFLVQFLAKLGLFSTFPGHSCKDIRDSGDSEGDGEYWIDPAKDGNPIKVYCDMTTDEGKKELSMLIKVSRFHGRGRVTFCICQEHRLK